MVINNKIKTISLTNDDLSNLTLTNNITEESTKTINIDNTKLKKYIKFDSLKILTTLKPLTTIKYIFKKNNKDKYKWAFLQDIILLHNKTILILKKGNYIWDHTINFYTTDYYYLHYY